MSSTGRGWSETAIEGVARRTLTPVADERGSFSELWRSAWTAELGEPVAQANLSRSEPGVLRGMHFHERQADLWVIVDGLAWVALTDLRPVIDDDRMPPVVERFELSPGDAVYIPRGVAHGFLAVERVALLYLVTREYDGTDEHGFAWDDPVAAIGWPTTAPILSRRDSGNPSLGEAVRAARQRGALVEPR